ncbi:hypothetical protein LINPERHAP2_LOCUS35020, partial [Linum perenne]
MVQIRDRTFSIASSFGRFGSDFRLEVSHASSSHFIFLEEAQLRWLEGVLSSAEASNWVFPNSCVAKSARRSIGITRFNVRGTPTLKVVEDCVSGQSFFILIPEDSSRGWPSLSRKIREFLDISSSKTLVCSDNLWLLNVSSRTVALRIMALKRWKFKDWSILMDTWTETAGRSQCLEKSNEAWVVVRGIPLHLRSMELFRKIGEFCDGFICAEDGLSLSSIRLKVKRGALIPEEAPICFGSVIFPVSIEAEAQNPLSPHGPRSTFPSWWKAKRKGIMLHNLQSEMEPLPSNLKSPSSRNGGSGQ